MLNNNSQMTEDNKCNWEGCDEKVATGPKGQPQPFCNDHLKEAEHKQFSEIETPEGGWSKGSDMDRI